MKGSAELSWQITYYILITPNILGLDSASKPKFTHLIDLLG